MEKKMFFSDREGKISIFYIFALTYKQFYSTYPKKKMASRQNNICSKYSVFLLNTNTIG